jgi:hypothetical protein
LPNVFRNRHRLREADDHIQTSICFRESCEFSAPVVVGVTSIVLALRLG